ncbi:hypothetical protein MVEN_02459000 [Mycena venus]|uniref:Uncharacterized protein n=1 Tax=Mycena venus TaxID=2733690 RepID=A0A8H7CA84_9AGAR|nr:hypothetical protein MVEN_02459000 [Mycena venus]
MRRYWRLKRLDVSLHSGSMGRLGWNFTLCHHHVLSPMLWSLGFLPFLCFHPAFAKLVTTIIDDAFQGDTHSSIAYSLPNAWGAESATVHGRVAPDASQAQNGTWHDTTDDTTPDHDGTTPTFMEISFQGTGIDIRCIIANNKAGDPNSIPPFTGTKSNYSFFIDSVPQNKDFVHEAGTTGDIFLYNTSVFSINTLPNGPHTLKLLLNGGPEVDGSVLLLFDYAIVTSDDGTGDAGTTTGETTVIPAPRPISTAAVTTTAGSSAKPSSALSSSQSRTVGPNSLTDPTGTAGATAQSQRPTSVTVTSLSIRWSHYGG